VPRVWTKEQREQARQRINEVNERKRQAREAGEDPALFDAQATSAAGDKPPRGPSGAGAKGTRPPVGAPTKRRGQAIARKITQLVHFTAGIVTLRDPFDGAVLAAGAPKLGETYGAVLERHPRVLAALEQFEQGGVYGAAAVATLTVALPIAAHHNLLPAGPLVALANAMIPREVMERMATYGQAQADVNGNPVAAAA
jgi:hypothetical protein